MEISDRIEKVIVDNKLTKSEFARIVGISTGNLGDWKRGKSIPGANALKRIAENFNVSLDWLILGKEQEPVFHSVIHHHTLTDTRGLLTEEEERELLEQAKNELEWMEFTTDENNRRMLTSLIKRLNSEDLAFMVDLAGRLFKQYNIQELARAPEQDEEEDKAQSHDPDRQPEYTKDAQEVYYVPVISQIAAGQPIGPEDFIEGYLPLPVSLVKDRTFLTRVKGDSMIGDGIHDGDIVQIRIQPVVDNGDIAAIRINSEVTLKHFIRQNNTIILRSSNPDYQDIIVQPGDEVDIIGKYINNFPREETEPLIDRFKSV